MRGLSNRKESQVDKISVDLIDINLENPRLIFNETELLILLKSIDEVGILVPLIVFHDKPGRYTLLDGERRLRCARRLNLAMVPVNVIQKPDKIENILRMFNIHNIREQWKLMPTALKLQVLLEDVSFKGKSDKDIARLTGMSISTVHRCQDLIDLSQKYQNMILQYYESGEPRDFKFTEDFFLELNRALKSIKKFHRDIYEKYSKTGIIDRFIEKRKKNVISDIIDFRLIPKIIGATRYGALDEEVQKVLIQLIEDVDYKINEAYDKVAEPLIKAKNIEDLCFKLIEQIQNIPVSQFKNFSKREKFLTSLRNLKKIIEENLSKYPESRL